MNRAEKMKIMSQAPILLRELMDQIPENIAKIRRKQGKWSIHEHVCHLAASQRMIIARFQIFKDEVDPFFKPYLPGKNVPDSALIDMDLEAALDEFETGRKELLELLENYSEVDWGNYGQHPEYQKFTPDIFLRHVMMHDHFHMYRIEELWLTRKEFLI